jgi:hypothetical protein
MLEHRPPLAPSEPSEHRDRLVLDEPVRVGNALTWSSVYASNFLGKNSPRILIESTQ